MCFLGGARYLEDATTLAIFSVRKPGLNLAKESAVTLDPDLKGYEDWDYGPLA